MLNFCFSLDYEDILRISSWSGIQDEYSISSGENFILICEMIGKPEQRVTFEKVGEDNLGDNVYRNGNGLVFNNIQPTQRGVYQCTAESNYRTIKASVIINVNGMDISYIHESIPQIRNDLSYRFHL